MGTNGHGFGVLYPCLSVKSLSAIARRRRTWLNVFLRGSLRENSRFPLLGWCSGVSPSGTLWQVIKAGFWPAVRTCSRLELTAVRVSRIRKVEFVVKKLR